MNSVDSDAIPTSNSTKSKGAPSSTGARWTLVGAFFAKAKSFPGGFAFRAKERGIWCTWTYRMAADETERLAAGMSKFGVSRGDHVAIIGPNNPRLYMAILASQTIGAVPVLFHPDVASGEIAQHQTVHSLRLVFGNDLAGTGAVADCVADKSGWVGTVVAEKDDAQHIYGEKLVTYGAVLDEGASVVEGHHHWLERALSGLSDTAPALKSIAADSDRPVREITLNHAMIRRAIDVVSPLNAFGEGEDALAFLPMSYHADQLQFFCAITSGATLNTPESTLTVFADIRDISPTVLIATPPIYAKFRGLHEIRISLAARQMQSVVSSALVSSARAGMGEGGQSFLGLTRRLLLLNPIRRQMGFGSVKVAISTQSALPGYLRGFFGALGVSFTDLYGKAEYAGALAVSNGGSFPAEDPSLDIDKDGRLMALVDGRAASCLPGYAGSSDQAEAPATIETGDVATRRNGTWSVAGRLNSQLQLEDGTSLQPEPIEQRLADTPFIRAVVLVGHDRQELTAVVLPAIDRLSYWARQEAISFVNTTELLDDARTKDLFQSLVSKVNSEINTAYDEVRIHQVLVLPDSAAYLSRHGAVQRRKIAELAANPATVADAVS